MKVKFENSGTCRKIMHIDVPSDAVVSEYDNVLKAYIKVAKIPGFRAGKVPMNIVERRYAKEIVDEVKDRLVPRFYREALNKEAITPIAVVDIHDVVFKKERGLTFKVTIDLAPEFKLPKYRKIVLKKNKIEIGSKEVDKALDQLKESFARFEDVTGRRNVLDGDMVKIDYSGICEGKQVDELSSECTELGKGKDFWVLIGEPEFLPGFSNGLVGASIDEKKEIHIHFPHDYHVSAVTDKDAVYVIEVKGIREKILPKIDDEFLKKLHISSEEALREKIRDDLVKAAERNEEERLKDEIAKFLLEKTEFDLPQSIVEQETGVIARNMVQRIAMQGATREQIEGHRDKILNTAAQSSTDRVKLFYILNRIAEREEIEAEDSEVDDRIGSIAERYRMSPERFRADLEKKNGLERLKSDIRVGKTLDFLLQHAKIKK